MERRELLRFGSVIAGVGIAGCSEELGDNSESGPTEDQTSTATPEPTPRYSEGDLTLLTVERLAEQLDEDNWKESEEDPENWDKAFEKSDNNDRLIAFITIGIEIHESIEDAEQMIQDRILGQDEDELEIADESYVWQQNDHARAYFRESNAVGGVAAMRSSGNDIVPDTQRAIQAAREFYDGW